MNAAGGHHPPLAGTVHDHPIAVSVPLTDRLCSLREKALQRAIRTLRHVPNVHGLLALALCSVAFVFGRFSASSNLLPDSAPVRTAAAHNPRELAGAGASSIRRGGRLLREASSSGLQEVRLVTAAPRPAVDMLDPFQPDNFERGVAARLEAVKPHLAPGDSGEGFYRTVPFQVLSWYPRIVVYPNFVDKARAQQVMARASKLMYPSGLAYRPGDTPDADQQIRTSQGTFLGSQGDAALQYLDSKIAAVTQLPVRNGEAWNVLNYKHTQHYDSHMDSFDPKEYGPQRSQRVATVIVVLSAEGLTGGETVFKREGRGNLNKTITNWRGCDGDGGFRYQPRTGDAVLFWSAAPDGTLDGHSLHGSCPVLSGEKWVAVKWLRDKGDY